MWQEFYSVWAMFSIQGQKHKYFTLVHRIKVKFTLVLHPLIILVFSVVSFFGRITGRPNFTFKGIGEINMRLIEFSFVLFQDNIPKNIAIFKDDCQDIRKSRETLTLI